MAVNRELSDRIDNVLNDVLRATEQQIKVLQSQKDLTNIIRAGLSISGDVQAAKPSLQAFEALLGQEAEQATNLYEQVRRLNSVL